MIKETPKLGLKTTIFWLRSVARFCFLALRVWNREGLATGRVMLGTIVMPRRVKMGVVIALALIQ